MFRHLRLGLANLFTRRNACEEVDAYFAEAAAAGSFRGDAERVRDQLRAYGWENALGELAADLRCAARQLRHNPAFSVTAVAVLALGIGVGSAMFSVLHAVLLRPLPYAHPSQLVNVTEPSSMAPAFWASSHPDVMDWRRDSHAFESLAYYQWGMATLEGRADSLEVSSFQASPNLFATLGRLPARGRAFTPGDVTAHARVAVLSWSLARKWFGAHSAVGQTVRMNGADYAVVGVMPQGFRFPYDQAADIWTPYLPSHPDPRDAFNLHVIGRLRGGVSVAAAQAALSAVQANLAARYASLHLSQRVAVERYADSLVGSVRPALRALSLAVGLVWLIACASVAGLMLTRLAARRRELAVRAALGASRARLARQLLSESLVLGLFAAALGWLLARLCLAALGPYTLARVNNPSLHLSVSGTVLLSLLAATLLSVVLIGLAPALGASRVSAAGGLQDRSLGLGRSQTRLRQVLVIGEIALALILLAGAGLLLRTLQSLGQVPLGFRTDDILTTRLNIPTDLYARRGIYQNLEQPLLAKLNALPGVEASAVSSVLPLGSNNIHIEGEFGIVGRPHLLRTEAPEGDMRYTSPGYARVFGIPLLRGRFFDAARDTAASEPVVVINQAMAVKYFPNQNPIGQQLTIGVHAGAAIIGVLADVHVQAVGTPPRPVVHFSTTQLAPRGGAAPFYSIGAQFVQLAVRSSLPAAVLAPEVRAALHLLAPEVSAGAFATEQQLVSQSIGDQTFAARLLSLFGLAALIIALAGLYGLLACTVAQRRRELGIRLALGASPVQVRRLVLGNAAALIAAGIAIGLAAALALAKVLASYLYGVAPHDAVSLLGAAILLGLCAFAAAWVPARRAAAVNPVETLRGE